MYQALYRKWRPRVFEDVWGQGHITKTLLNEIRTDTVAHAYLFTGSRGTGKTTCAKILAKAVNCLHPHDGDPCNECENCRGIDSGAIMDVVEIDAASNNGVDNIRELREETVFSPAVAKYRVYIIDEVHMLSGGAFNALLKTLEEPPAYVLFILATTEVHKLPATILSRCQRFDFRRIPPEDIAGRLVEVAKAEQLRLTQGGADLIARLSDGALRDALSLLERCAGAGGDLNEETVARIAGLSGRDYLFDLASAFLAGDFAAALGLLDGLYAQSKDMERLCEELIGHFRNLLLLRSAEEAGKLVRATPEELARLQQQAQAVSSETALHLLDTLARALETLRRSASPRVEMEMCLMRLCDPSLDSSPSALLRRVSALEEALRSGARAAVAERPPAPVPSSAPVPAAREEAPEPPSAPPPPRAEAETRPASAPQGGETPLACWPEVLDILKRLDPALGGVLRGSKAVVHGEHVLVDSTNAMFAELIRKSAHQKPLLEAVRQAAGRDYKVGIFKRSLNIAREDDPLDELLRNASASGVGVRET